MYSPAFSHVVRMVVVCIHLGLVTVAVSEDLRGREGVVVELVIELIVSQSLVDGLAVKSADFPSGNVFHEIGLPVAALDNVLEEGTVPLGAQHWLKSQLD